MLAVRSIGFSIILAACLPVAGCCSTLSRWPARRHHTLVDQFPVALLRLARRQSPLVMKDNAAGEAAMPHLAAVYEKRLTPIVQGACGCLRSVLLHKPRWTTDVNSLLRRHDVIILRLFLFC